MRVCSSLSMSVFISTLLIDFFWEIRLTLVLDGNNDSCERLTEHMDSYARAHRKPAVSPHTKGDQMSKYLASIV